MRSPVQRLVWPIIAAALVLVVGAGIAYATIPDSGGVIHTCFKPNDASKAGGRGPHCCRLGERRHVQGGGYCLALEPAGSTGAPG